MDRVVKRQTQQHANKLESKRYLIRESIEPVESAVVFGEEHVEVGIEDGLCH